MLDHEGLAPVLDSCVRCSSNGPLVALDVGEGGAYCESCRQGRSLSDQALAVMRAVLGGGLERALLVEDPRICEEVDRIATEAVEFHLERRMRARRVMHSS